MRAAGRRLLRCPEAAAGLGRQRVRLGPDGRPLGGRTCPAGRGTRPIPLAVEDPPNGRQPPKHELFGDVLTVALKPLRYAEEDTAIETGDIMIFVDPRSILTVSHGQIDPCGEATRRLDADPQMLRTGPWAVLHALLDVVVDAYSDAVRRARVTLDRLEDEMFSTSRVDHTQRIYSLKRELRDAVQPLVPVLRACWTARVRKATCRRSPRTSVTSPTPCTAPISRSGPWTSC
ncbi:CorA family divalent cation transporter [Streptomyces sp. NPDC056492]|uniref:CorA family divalent cation transporter n=1 Tax=unclassified Streptomyces TaxID=2593676 RepID=UPI0036C1216C